jgi:peroxiredoxin
MRTTFLALFAAIAMVLSSSPAVFGQQEGGASAKAAKAGDKDAPKPEQLIRATADYLAGLPGFSHTVDSKLHLKHGEQEMDRASKTIVRWQRPNRYHIVVEEANSGITVVSDGKREVVYLPSMKRYAVTELPADETLTRTEGLSLLGRFGVHLPTTADALFDSIVNAAERMEYVGKEKIDQTMCHHCRLTSEQYGVDVWIEADETKPLLRKIQPDLSRRVPEGASVEYVMLYKDWDVAPKFTDADFAFSPPEDAEQVDSLFEQPPEPVHPLVGQPAPDFETVGPDDHPITLKDQLGKNVIMLDFWATWCGPCVMAMPKVEAVAKKFADKGLVFYAVNSGEDAETIKEFLKNSNLDVPVALDLDGNITGQLYQAEGIPQTVLIGKDGKVQVVHVGYSESLADELTTEIEALLQGKDLASEQLAKAEKDAAKSDEAEASETEQEVANDAEASAQPAE